MRFGDEPGAATDANDDANETWVRKGTSFIPQEKCQKINLGSELSGWARSPKWMYSNPPDLNLRDVDKHRDGAKIVVPKWEGHIEPS